MSKIRYHGALDRTALTQALCTAALFGTVPVSIKATQADAWAVGLVRLIVPALLFPLLFPSAPAQLFQARRHWRVLLLMGVVFGLHWITYFIAIKWSSAGLATTGVASYGVHILWMGCLLTRSWPRGRDLGCLALLLSGVFLVAPHSDPGSTMLPGFLLALFSGWLWAVLPLLNQRAADIPVRVRSLSQYLAGLLVFLPFAGNAQWELHARDWLLLGYLATVGTLLAHTLWIRVSGILPAFATSIIYYLHLPVALTLSYFFLGEELSSRRALGIVLIAIGSWIGIAVSLSRREG